MPYRLALDIGTNSIGWCLFDLDLDADRAPSGLRDAGVRIFPDGRDPKTLASLAAERRLARGARRRRDRYLRRRERLLAALVRHGLMPADAAAAKALAGRDPYALRRDALHRRLDPHELGRVIFHLNQRRGFRSNRKTDRGNEEERGKIATAADALRAEMSRTGAPTLGAWLADRQDRREGVRARLVGAGAKAAYAFYPTRDLVRAEFDAIWAAQAAWNPALTETIRDAIAEIVFHQRPLREPPVGRCFLEPGEPRAPKALPSTQAFRIAQDLAHLRIQRAGEPDRILTEAEAATLRAELATGRDLTWAQIRKLLKLSKDDAFNLESKAREKLKGAETAARLGRGKAPLAAVWPGLSDAQRDAAVAALIEADEPEQAIAALMALGIPEAAAEAAERVTLPEGHASLSLKAIRTILAAWTHGLTYDKAVLAAGYRHHSDDRDGVLHASLPYYGEVLFERLGTGTGHRDDPVEKRWGRAPNPTVHVALNQLRRVVNAIIARHGPPAEIVVEVLRELNQSAFERRRIEKEQAENARRREGWAKELRELGQPVNGRNLDRLRLWYEQAGDGDPKERICPYTGQRLGIAAIFTDAVEEDHILPFAITLDNSFANRILCAREANRRKTRQSPFEAFGSGPDWEDIKARAAQLPRAKAWRFAPDAMERWKGEHADFLDRHIHDSAYIARLARLYLRAVCDPDRVWVVPGRLTGLLRGALGLHSDAVLGRGGPRKDRTDHRHHAVDAVVVGLVDRSLLQRVSHAAARAPDRGRRLLDDIGEPWPGFVAEVAAKLRGIAVSFKTDTAPSGRLHNDTAYGVLAGAGAGEPNVVHRVPVASLAGKSPGDAAEALGNTALAARVAAVLASVEGKPAQAAALSALPHDAKGRVVRRVRLRERLDGTAAIRDRTTGQPYKRVKLDANHRVEFWRLPPQRGEPARVRMLVVPMLRAAQEAEAKRLNRPVPDGRPHPAAKLLMRLHKNDVVAFGEGEARRLFRVVKFRDGQVNMAEANESGNLKQRDSDPTDPFRYINASLSRFAAERARKVFVDPAGRVHDPGPLPW